MTDKTLKKLISKELKLLWKPYMAQTKVKVSQSGWVKPKKIGRSLGHHIWVSNLVNLAKTIKEIEDNA